MCRIRMPGAGGAVTPAHVWGTRTVSGGIFVGGGGVKAVRTGKGLKGS